MAPWYDQVEEFIGVSGAAEGLPQLPDGKFQPPMALNVVEQHVREADLGQRWPERRLTIGRTANLTEAKERAERTASTARSARAAAPTAPISRPSRAPCRRRRRPAG